MQRRRLNRRICYQQLHIKSVKSCERWRTTENSSTFLTIPTTATHDFIVLRICEKCICSASYFCSRTHHQYLPSSRWPKTDYSWIMNYISNLFAITMHDVKNLGYAVVLVTVAWNIYRCKNATIQKSGRTPFRFDRYTTHIHEYHTWTFP